MQDSINHMKAENNPKYTSASKGVLKTANV